MGHKESCQAHPEYNSVSLSKAFACSWRNLGQRIRSRTKDIWVVCMMFTGRLTTSEVVAVICRYWWLEWHCNSGIQHSREGAGEHPQQLQLDLAANDAIFGVRQLLLMLMALTSSGRVVQVGNDCVGPVRTHLTQRFSKVPQTNTTKQE